MLGASPASLPHRPHAGAVYRELIEQQVQEEAARKASFEQRGIAVITSSGAFVSLVFGIGAVVTATTKNFSPTLHVKALLVGALSAFALAAVCGIITNWPMKYKDLSVRQLRRYVSRELWYNPAEVAARRAAEARVGVVAAARNRNALKGDALIGAMILQVAAISLIAGAVVLILTDWWT